MHNEIVANDSLRKRFEDKTVPAPPSSCVLWLGYVMPNGYGQFYLGGRHVLAHRAAWELFNGPIPAGAQVLHKCDVPSCVNVLGGHLFLGSQADNVADCVRKGRNKHPIGDANRAKTHCPMGHEYAGYNLLVYSGKRSCKECMAVRGHAWFIANKNRPNDRRNDD